MKKMMRSNAPLGERELTNQATYNLISKKFAETRCGKQMWTQEFDFFFGHLSPGCSVLDLGCGEGRLLSYIAEHGKEVSQYTGIDFSNQLLQEARRRHHDVGVSHTFVEGYLQDFPVSATRVDVVCMIASFHHLLTKEDRLRCLELCKESLNDGGLLCMTNWKEEAMKGLTKAEYMGDGVYNMPFTDNEGKKGDRYYYGFAEGELEREALGVGLEVCERMDTKHNDVIILRCALQSNR